MKKFLALARVSSREQEREGFSLDVQEDALRRYADRNGGTLIKLYRIAETASKKDERKVFKELIAFAKVHAKELAGLLFYKVDRAARNLFDYVELERLESEYGVPFISVSQPTDSTPAGRMQRRMLASMASFYTEQQAVDVREGQARRVKGGLFIGLAPYGYRNIRKDGRGLIEVHPENAAKVRRIFELYAYHGHTLDSLVQKLADESLTFTTATPRFTRSKVHAILRDRAYIGEVRYGEEWLPGSHPPLIDRALWDRVQALLGQKVYRAHQLTFGSELITCTHCGRAITGEIITKKTTGKEYAYYRCSGYNAPGHPRDRVSEAALDRQVVAMFERMVVTPDVQDWFLMVLRARTQAVREESMLQHDELTRQISSIEAQKDKLVNLRLADEIDAATFSKKNTELRDRTAQAQVQLDALGRGRAEHAEIAVQVFELSQNFVAQWVKARPEAKRQILDLVCLNLKLNGASLCPTMRKPFDLTAEGLNLAKHRGDKI